MKNRGPILIGAAIILMLATIGTLSAMWQHEKRNRKVAQDNITALQDTMRLVKTDHAAAVSLLLFQGEIDQDSMAQLNEALALALDDRNAKAVALQHAEFRFDSLLATTTAEIDSITEEGVRLATTFVEGPPIDGEINVAVPPEPTEPVVFRTLLTVTPFQASYTLGCTETNIPVVALETPPWVRVSLQRGVVSPNMCNPAPTYSLSGDLFQITPGKLIWSALSFVGGFVVSEVVRK